MSLAASALAVVATGKTSVVISNLAYLVGAVVLAIVIISVVAIRYRRPRTTEEDMDDFHRGLAALDPDRAVRHRSGGRRARAATSGPTTSGPTASGPTVSGPTVSGTTASRVTVPSVRPQSTAGRPPVVADGSTPRRPSTRSQSG